MDNQNAQQYEPAHYQHYEQRSVRQHRFGGVVFAAILILVGASLLLDNLGLPGLGALFGSAIWGVYFWPLVLIGLGGLIFYRWYNSTGRSY